MNPEWLQQLIDASFIAAATQVIEPLPSVTNQCWRVSTTLSDKEQALSRQNEPDYAPSSNGQFECVVKIFSRDEVAVKFSQLIRKTQQVAQLELTPPLLRVDEQQRAVLMPFRRSPTYFTANLPTEQKIEHLAMHLATLHRQPLNFPEFSVADDIQHYCSALAQSSPLLAQFQQLPTLTGDQSLVPCHMDPSLNNLLANGEWLDLEFARLAPPLFDLAAAVTINEFSTAQAKQLFSAYESATFMRHNAADFERFCAWSQWLNDAWYALKGGSEPSC
ncbi:MAG: phosphotransferase [Gammaproteobacteria bacterium]|nr:phosphotransferase [Gammaproteobacteria bacterium]